ncbi:MAG: hypothetical protein ACRDRJ_05115 [Streptosporangiaceae bacterium]
MSATPPPKVTKPAAPQGLSRLNSRLVWGSLGAAALALSGTFAQSALPASPRDWAGNLMLAAYGLLAAAGVFGYFCASGIRFPVLGERPSSPPEPDSEPGFPILGPPLDHDPRSDLRQALDAAGVVPPQTAELSADQRWLRLVNQLVKEVGWDEWQYNVYPFFDPNSPWVKISFTQRLGRANEWVLSRAWPPGHAELRESIDTYGRVIADLVYTFHKHAEEGHSGKVMMTERFYRNKGNFNPTYHEDIAKYEHHIELLEDLVLEATRYANHIADLVRSEIEPDFRAEEGALLVKYVYGVFQLGLLKPEFRPEDFAHGQPYKDLQSFDTDRASRDVSMKAD